MQKACQHQVEHGVLADGRGLETIEDVGEVAFVAVGLRVRVFHQHRGQDAHYDDQHADDGEERAVIIGDRASIVGVHEEHRAAEHQQHGQKRHGGIHAFHAPAVGVVGGVGDPGVEAGIVGGAAEERHDAVADDSEDDAQLGGRGSIACKRGAHVLQHREDQH